MYRTNLGFRRTFPSKDDFDYYDADHDGVVTYDEWIAKKMLATD